MRRGLHECRGNGQGNDLRAERTIKRGHKSLGHAEVLGSTLLHGNLEATCEHFGLGLLGLASSTDDDLSNNILAVLAQRKTGGIHLEVRSHICKEALHKHFPAVTVLGRRNQTRLQLQTKNDRCGTCLHRVSARVRNSRGELNGFANIDHVAVLLRVCNNILEGGRVDTRPTQPVLGIHVHRSGELEGRLDAQLLSQRLGLQDKVLVIHAQAQTNGSQGGHKFSAVFAWCVGGRCLHMLPSLNKGSHRGSQHAL